jgi:hypothetical protein
MELHHATDLLGLLCRGTKATHSSQNDGSPSLLPRHTRWINIVDVLIQPPLIASGALCDFDGEKAKALTTSCIMLGMGSERPLLFSSKVQIARRRTVHLALLIFINLGQESPFLTTDLEACPAPLPMVASGGDHDKRYYSGSPRHNCHQLSSRRARTHASSPRALPSVGYVFNLC